MSAEVSGRSLMLSCCSCCSVSSGALECNGVWNVARCSLRCGEPIRVVRSVVDAILLFCFISTLSTPLTVPMLSTVSTLSHEIPTVST